MPSIAIVGAGPGMGLAIARTFGSQGFDVALIARNRDKLNDLAGRLDAEGITAAAFPAEGRACAADYRVVGSARRNRAKRRGCSPCPPPSSRPSTSRRRSASPGLCGAM
ncbi:SDR family NAD(P)-dependent oxidoreductase [Streptomyces sp. NPDC058378]|uniref:SDR family NAD(P)-dependent oxidoreductase n=1 Tax=Streptomyces sp. NPDC058378 TaxID=3346469 RepID=UPI003657D07E